MDYETKAFAFTPPRVAGAIRFARENGGQRAWRDSTPGCRLVLVAGSRTAAYYARVKKDGKEQKLRLGEAEGPAAITIGEARERAGKAKYGAEMPTVRKSKGSLAGVTVESVWQAYKKEATAGTFSLRRRGNRPLSAKTLKGYASTYSCHVQPGYGGKDVGLLARDAVELVRRVAASSPSVGNQVLATVTAIVEFSRRRGLFAGKNPFRDLDESVRSYVAPHEVKLTAEQAVAVFAALLELEEGWRDLFLFLALTGRRVSNARALAWSQVDTGAGEIVYPSTTMKARRPSVVPLTAALKAIIERRTAARVEGQVYVWPAINDPKKPILNVHHQWAKVRERSGVLDLTPKGLRHNAVTWALQSGCSQAVVGAMADHKDASVTARYTHLTTADSLPALEALETLWGEAEKKARRVKRGQKEGRK